MPAQSPELRLSYLSPVPCSLDPELLRNSDAQPLLFESVRFSPPWESLIC